MRSSDIRLVFAYSMAGLFVGYLYFSIPRVILTVMAAVGKLDPALEEAARSLGATPWQVMRDVVIPGLRPALIASGAICFATSMGAFGTAFTLATQHQRAADHDLHRVHELRELFAGGGAVPGARPDHLGRARVRAQPRGVDRRGGGVNRNAGGLA